MTSEFDRGVEEGRRLEREAVVAWLCSHDMWTQIGLNALLRAAGSFVHDGYHTKYAHTFTPGKPIGKP